MHDSGEELLTIGEQLRLFHYCEPTNTEEARTAFFAGKEPEFHYPPLPFNPQELRARLAALRFDGDYATLYEQARDALLLQLDILSARGEPRVRTLALTLYGRPSAEVIRAAHGILQSPHEPSPKTIPAPRIKEAFERALAQRGLSWTVSYAEKNATTIDPMNRQITLNKNRFFAEHDLQRLIVHEIDVHVLRAENGHAQAARFFITGLPGYLTTEEGLAAYAEEQTGTARAENRRALAGHVLAVDALHRGLSFRAAYELLTNYFPPAEAWRLTLRSYRAGGLAKDHVYLQGLHAVKRFVAAGGSLRSLYVGKIGIEHLPLLPASVVPPQHLPGWLRA